VLRSGVCKLCGKQFEYEYSTGRPRGYCLSCQPAGWAVVTRPNGRRKLRRIHPLLRMSDVYPLGGVVMPKRLRAVGPDEKPAKPRNLTVAQAAADGTHQELLLAVQGRIAEAVQAPNCNPVALAALSRMLVSFSRELAAIAARGDDEVGEAAKVPDEAWDGTI
jgi:hypothetical protein